MRSEKKNKEYELKIQTLISEKASVFQSVKAIELTIQDNHDMKNIIDKLMKKVEDSI